MKLKRIPVVQPVKRKVNVIVMHVQGVQRKEKEDGGQEAKDKHKTNRTRDVEKQNANVAKMTTSVVLGNASKENVAHVYVLASDVGKTNGAAHRNVLTENVNKTVNVNNLVNVVVVV